MQRLPAMSMHCATHSGAQSSARHKRGAGEAFSRITQPLPTCMHAANPTMGSPCSEMQLQATSLSQSCNMHTSATDAPKRSILAPTKSPGCPTSPSTVLRAQQSAGLARLPKARARAVGRAGSWEGSKLTWKLVRIILDALEGCGARGAVIQSYLRHADECRHSFGTDSVPSRRTSEWWWLFLCRVDEA